MNGNGSNVVNKHLTDDAGNVVNGNREKADLLASKFAEISSTENYSETFRKTKRDAESDPQLLENNAEPNEYNGLLNIPFAANEFAKSITADQKR